MTGRPPAFTGLPLADLRARRDRLRATLAAIDAAIRRAETPRSPLPRPPRPTRPIVVRAADVIAWARAHGTAGAVSLPEVNRHRHAMGLGPFTLADAPA